MNRSERRRRNKVIYDRRARLFLRLFLKNVPCKKEEAPIHNSTIRINSKYWRNAESYKDLQKNSQSMHLYKNTGTIWDHGYWTKYERRRLNKQSRHNAKLDLRNSVEYVFNRTSIK